MFRKTKSIRLYQSSTSINLNLDATTDIKDRKRKHQKIEYIDGSEGEQWVSLGKTITVAINHLNHTEYDMLRKLWKSNDTLLIYTERNEQFKVRFLQDIFDMVEDESFDNETFYYGTIELTEV